MLSFFADIDLGASTLTISNQGTVSWQSFAHLTGAGGLVKTGAGALSLFSSNSFDGTVQVDQGQLIAYQAGTLGSGLAGTSVATNATLELNFAGPIFTMNEPLTIAGTLSVTGGRVFNNAPVTLSSTNAVIDIASLPSGLDFNANILSGVAGAGFTKSGFGQLVLQGSSTQERTTIQTGTVLINGAQPSNQVLLASGGSLAALGGTGTVGSVLAVNLARIAPGNSPGILTCSNVAMTNTHFVAELNGTTPGSGHDQLNVRGTVAISLSAFLDVTVGFNAVPGDSFTVINNDGADAVSGIFNGRPEGSFSTNGATALQISYSGGDGNDVVLTTTGILPTGNTRQWTGAGANGLWSNPTNWVGNTPPVTGDTLEFPVTAASLVATNDFVAFAANRIQFTGSAGTVHYLLGGNRVVLLAGISSEAQHNGQSQQFFCPLRLLAAQSFGAGTNSGLAVVLRFG